MRQMPRQKSGNGLAIVGPMQLRLAQAVDEEDGGAGGGQAALLLEGGQGLEDALQQGRLGVRHALHQSQPGPAVFGVINENGQNLIFYQVFIHFLDSALYLHFSRWRLQINH